MKYEHPTSNGRKIHRKLIVVEAANYCRCHTTVVVRGRNQPNWFVFLVANLYGISFGDTVEMIEDRSTNPPHLKFYLVRGPSAKYHLHLEDIPDSIVRAALDGLVDSDSSGEVKEYR